MKFKYGNVVLAAATALCLSSTAFADDEPGVKLGDWMPGTLSGSLTLISDYSFRGISQTRTDFALQGSVTWKHEIGVYLGTWGSSVSFGDDDSFLEQDWIAGFSRSIGDFTYDFSATYLWYPKEEDYSYWEFAAKGAYALPFATLKAGVVWSPDYFNYAGDGGYFSTGATVPLPIPENRYVTLAIDGNVGYTVTDKTLFIASHHDVDTGEEIITGTDDDYVDWNLGLLVGVTEHITVDLRYVDTDTRAYGDGSDARFVGGVTFAF